MNYLIIGGVVLIVCVLYVLITYNTLIKLRNNVNEAFATMDVYLKKRWDLIPNLVEAVKGYASHEEKTLEEISKLRSGIYDDLSNESKIETNKKLSININKIMLLAESYPELKANKNFLSLGEDLTKIENDIAQSRKYYNAVVRDFNNKVEMIPSNIVALIMGLKVKVMFTIEENDRKNVKVNL